MKLNIGTLTDFWMKITKIKVSDIPVNFLGITLCITFDAYDAQTFKSDAHRT